MRRGDRRGPRRRCNNPVPTSRRELVYFILGGFFLTNAILDELTGGKLFSMPAVGLGRLGLPEVVFSIGVIPLPEPRAERSPGAPGSRADEQNPKPYGSSCTQTDTLS